MVPPKLRGVRDFRVKRRTACSLGADPSGLAGEQTHHQPVGLGEHIAVGVAQLGVDERLTAVGLPDLQPRAVSVVSMGVTLR